MKLQNPRDIKFGRNHVNGLTDEDLDPHRSHVQTLGGMIFVNEHNEACTQRDVLEIIACVDMGISEVKTYELCYSGNPPNEDLYYTWETE